ncbi:MAG: SMC-Scp complex subunit ScpB [Elusimicrobiota bacterium]
MEGRELKNIIECLLFVSSKPVTVKEIEKVFEESSKDLDNPKKEIKDTLKELAKEYDVEGKPIFIQKIAGGWRMATREKYGGWVKKLYSKETTYNLSKAALESLAIVAYRQPVTTKEVEAIRGVSCGAVLRGLLEKKLIKISGRKESIGRPIIYKTTQKFLEYFGLESLSDLPPLEEMGIDENIEEIINEEIAQ